MRGQKNMETRNKRPQPYIGISGITNFDNTQKWIEKAANETGITEHRLLMLGVKGTYTTQWLDSHNGRSRYWYPVGNWGFNSALNNPGEGTLGVAQVYMDPWQVKEQSYREQFVERIFQRGAPWIGGIQFDKLPWHNNPDMVDFVSWVKDTFQTKIFLQCHGEAQAELGPKGVARKLGEYALAIDYVLLDSSHGTYKQLDPSCAKTYLDEMYNDDDLAGVGIAVAGGLHAKAVGLILPELVREYPDLSWDAESGLHRSYSETADIGRAELYMLMSKLVIQLAEQSRA